MNRFFTLMLMSALVAGVQAEAANTFRAAKFAKKVPAKTAGARTAASKIQRARAAAADAAVKYLPGKITTSVWDESTEEWIKVAVTDYVYNPDGTTASETEADIEEGGESLNRTTYGYDDQQREILRIGQTSDDGGETWTFTDKRVREYDSVVKNFVTLLEMYSWQNDWLLSIGNRYLLDRNDKGLLTMMQRQVMYEEAYDTTAKIENGVEGDSITSSKVSEMTSYDGEIWWETPIDLREIKWHNTDGQPMAFEVEAYSRGANRVAYAKSYYEDEYEGEATGEYANDVEGKFVFSFVDGSSLTIETEYTDEATGSYRETYRVVYPMFDEDSGETYTTDETEITDMIFDDYGNLIEEHQTYVVDGTTEFSGGILCEYEYDDNGAVVAQTESSFADIEIDEETTEREIYPELRLEMSDFVTTTGIAGVGTAARVTFAGRTLTVDCEGPASVEVYSLDGRSVMARSLSGAGTVSLSQLEEGAYIVKVTADKSVQTIKIGL